MPESRSAEYRALHRVQGAQGVQRAQQPEQPGISWSSGRPGPVQPPAGESSERFAAERAAREHLAGLRPDAERAAEGGPGDTAGNVPGSGAIPPLPKSALPRSVPAVPSAAWVAGRSGTPAPPAARTADPDGEPLYRVLAGLAMRDLTLVESLLQVVEELESREGDAAQLELLFRIDHLATRMRRNSENLLVLAGHAGESRDLEPVPLLDVARAAISEITEYSRAKISSLPDATLIGPAADDVSHILAELLDNAMSKSPESAAVIVRAERTGDGTMVLSVEDAGIGIPVDHLADINARLARAPVIEAAATRHMGLYVVGRLAQRHGIRVQLRERPSGGILAQVILPSRLVRGQPGASSSYGRANHPRPLTRPDTGRPDTGQPDTGQPDTSIVSVPAPAPAPEGRQAPPSPSRALAPPSRAPAPPVTPRFAPADPSGLPQRTRRAPRQPAAANGTPATDSGGAPAPAPASIPTPAAGESSAAAEPGDSRASQLRDDLSGFLLGQRAARGNGLPELHHGGGTPGAPATPGTPATPGPPSTPGPEAEPDGENAPGEGDGGVGTEMGLA